MSILNWSDYNLPSFKLGSVKRQPLPFKREQPFAGAMFIKPTISSFDDVPTMWDVTLTLDDAQMVSFNNFITDLFEQPEKQFVKKMYLDYGENNVTLRITSGRPQPVHTAFNQWQVAFAIYADYVDPTQSIPPAMPEFSKRVDSDPVPQVWHKLTPKWLNSGKSPFASGQVTALASRDGSPHAVACFDSGYASISHDRYRTWSALTRWMNSGADTITPVSNSGAKCAAISKDGSVLFFGFIGGKASVSTNGGALFTTLPNGLGVQTNTNILACAMSADGTRIIAAFDGGVYALSENSGSTWTGIYTGFGSSVSSGYYIVRDCAMSDDGQYIIVAHDDGRIAYSKNGGSTWSSGTQAMGNAIGDLTSAVRSVSISTDGKAWTLGFGNGFVAVSSDYENSWSLSPQGAGSELVPSSSPVLATGVSKLAQKVVAAIATGKGGYSTDNGKTYAATTAQFDMTNPVSSSAKIRATGQEWIIGGDNGELAVSGFTPDFVPDYPPARYPSSWTLVTPQYLNSGATSASLTVSCMSSDATRLFYGQNGGFASRSVNSGASWTAMTQGLNSGSTTSQVYALACSADGLKVIAGFAGGWASISNDGGATWTGLTRYLGSGSTGDIRTISMSQDGQRIFVGFSTGHASISYNGGSTFTALTRGLNSGTVGNLILSSAMSSDGQIIFAGFYQGYAAKSVDGGTTWTVVTRGFGVGTANNSVITMCMSKTGQYIYAGCELGEVKRSMDYGATWILCPAYVNSGATSGQAYAIACSFDGAVVVATIGTTGRVGASADYGLNWAALTQTLGMTTFAQITSMSTNGESWFATQQGGKASKSYPA